MPVGVDSLLTAEGRLRVRRIQLAGDWLPVGQGRQWQDEVGRHVLVMLPGDRPRELCLRRDSLTWELRPLPAHGSQPV
jgi:hypothetical protein